MSGTRIGGLKAAEKNKALHGEDFYSRIGRKGGQNGNTGGFYANRALATKMGKKGGKKSRRGAGVYKEILDANKRRIRYLYHYRKCSLPQIAEILEVSYAPLLKWAHENIKDYGVKK